MASVTEAVRALCAMLEEDVCPGLALKRAPAAGDFDTADPERVPPAVHPLWLPQPTDALLQTRRSLFPSIAVAASASVSLDRGEARLAVTMAIGTWNPGTHAGETDDPAAPPLALDAGGWAEGFVVAEKIIERLRRDSSIGGILSADLSAPVKMGPWEENGALIDFYPYYQTRLAFEATMGCRPPAYQSNVL